MLDINKYLQFSSWAKDVANEIDSAHTSIKQAIYTRCTGIIGTPVPQCEINGPLDLTHEKILKICQVINVADDICDNGVYDYKLSITRFSNWTGYNVSMLTKMQAEFSSVIMSAGNALEFNSFSLLNLNKDWQQKALNNGLWPDGNPIYKMGTTGLVDQKIISCHGIGPGCNLNQFFIFRDDKHFNHIHMNQ